METDHKEGGSREEPLGFALGAAARKLAKFYVQALAGHPLTPSQLFSCANSGWRMACPYVILGCAPSLMPPPPPGSSINWSKRAWSNGSATTPIGASCVSG